MTESTESFNAERLTAETPNYRNLIIELCNEPRSEVAATAEETEVRLRAALDAYNGLQPPEVNLPDTPDPTLKDLLRDRDSQYWLDREQVKEKGKVIQLINMDATPSNNALRLITNLPQEVPGEVLMWGVAKTMLAGRVWQSILRARDYNSRGEVDINSILDEEARGEISRIMMGRARIEIKDGQPVIKAHDHSTCGKAVGEEIGRRHDAWEQNHQLLARHEKLRIVLPLLADLAVGARSAFGISDVITFNYLNHLKRSSQQKVNA